jgi:SAM-dependent methyltransferase
MLNDHDRNAAYRTAIRRAAAGRIVYDLGAGMGPMSYYALTAGARRVYGFEIDRDAYPYLRRLTQRFPNFAPVRTDVLRGRLPGDLPDVVVCEMWSAWLAAWPMISALNRILRRAPLTCVIPAQGYHVVQLVQARHRAGMPVEVVPGSEASVFGEPLATAEMSLPALASVTDFRHHNGPLETVVSLVPLTTGTVNAVRLYSLEEVSEGLILPRIGTRSDELLRWITPVRARRGRRVRIHVRHRWDAGLQLSVDE